MDGHLEVLKWARENGCPWDEETCWKAAERGHLEVLQWARENGCPWNELTCAYAALGGHLETLKWLRENGCPWDELTCEYARVAATSADDGATRTAAREYERTRELAASKGYVES